MGNEYWLEEGKTKLDRTKMPEMADMKFQVLPPFVRLEMLSIDCE